jgi:hypothetical protein
MKRRERLPNEAWVDVGSFLIFVLYSLSEVSKRKIQHILHALCAQTLHALQGRYEIYQYAEITYI